TRRGCAPWGRGGRRLGGRRGGRRALGKRRPGGAGGPARPVASDEIGAPPWRGAVAPGDTSTAHVASAHAAGRRSRHPDPAAGAAWLRRLARRRPPRPPLWAQLPPEFW